MEGVEMRQAVAHAPVNGTMTLVGDNNVEITARKFVVAANMVWRRQTVFASPAAPFLV